MTSGFLPTLSKLEELFRQKYGDPATVGWAPKRRRAFGYFLPSDVYEAVVEGLVGDQCQWLDIGGGHNIFPENPSLAATLVKRAATVVAVDPSENVHRNQFAHQRVQAMIEDYKTEQQFDLATMRMVAEHVADPAAVGAALAKLVRPGGRVVILTVNQSAPLTLISRLIPFGLHHPIKSLFWGSEEEDTFPVQYKMNSRQQLAEVFNAAGFREVGFALLDDLSTWGRFGTMNYVELSAWRLLHAAGLSYPENCILAAYERES